MAITATNPDSIDGGATAKCTACKGTKGAPIAAIVDIGESTRVVLCQECGRDAANAIGFMCIRDGGWSKLEPRRRKAGAR